MEHVLHIVTGAPGAGKSTTLQAFLRLNTRFIAFDIDWLTIPASNLAGKDIIFEPSTWPAYNALWFEILSTIHKNHKRPVFFAPISPQDIALHTQPHWRTRIEWLLLDCDDQMRRRRLAQRPEWTEEMIEEALADAAQLRQTVQMNIQTDDHPSEQLARMIHDWLERTCQPL